MIIGYTKLTGTPDPASIDQTRRDLIAAGAETVYVDTDIAWQPLGIGRTRHGLEVALAACSQNDTLLALTPAQLAGSLGELIEIADRLASKGASLRVLQVAGTQVLDTSTPAGAMMLGALGLMSAFDRTAGFGGMPQGLSGMFGSGMATQKVDAFAPRRPRGRPPTATTQAEEIARLRAAGMRATDIAERLKICRASVYRVLNLTNPAAPVHVSASVTANASMVQPPVERVRDLVTSSLLR